jgi:hypothetical protein
MDERVFVLPANVAWVSRPTVIPDDCVQLLLGDLARLKGEKFSRYRPLPVADLVVRILPLPSLGDGLPFVASM